MRDEINIEGSMAYIESLIGEREENEQGRVWGLHEELNRGEGRKRAAKGGGGGKEGG